MASLLIAHGALWILIAALVLVLVLLSRQVGALHARVAPAGALAVNTVLEVGQPAPRLSVRTLADQIVQIGGDGAGRSRLLLFLAPDCPISRSLTPVLASLSRTEPWLDVLLVSDGEADDAHRSFAGSSDLRELDYALSESLGRACGISKVPYAVLIDEQNRVAALGMVNSREHLESLFEAKETGIESIQAFMAESEQFHPADGGLSGKG